MTPKPPRPLMRRLSHYLALSDAEIEALTALEQDQRQLKAGQRLVVEAGASQEMFVLQSGWLFTSTAVEGGARQILRVHQPGDIVNVACIAWSRVTATVTAATAARVSAFPRTYLSAIFAQHPRLSALLFGITVMENVALADRLTSLGRTDGRARISALLLELLSRQQITNGHAPDTLELFLSQTEIADAVGLTKVHVNRLLREMTEANLIARRGRQVQLLDLDALYRISGYVNRQTYLADDWYPHPDHALDA
jgi:CRP/FNR family transcriptional regulator, anaerobic regulatory protein